MKCFIDRLRECPKDYLEKVIKMQEADIEIKKRDLETMREVLREKTLLREE